MSARWRSDREHRSLYFQKGVIRITVEKGKWGQSRRVHYFWKRNTMSVIVRVRNKPLLIVRQRIWADMEYGNFKSSMGRSYASKTFSKTLKITPNPEKASEADVPCNIYWIAAELGLGSLVLGCRGRHCETTQAPVISQRISK